MLKEYNLQQQKRTKQVNAEERLVLNRLIFETKVYDDIPSVKNIDWKSTKREVELVNSAIANIKTNSESEDTKLLASPSFLATEMIGVKTRQKSEKSRKEPHWERRIEKNVKIWRKHLSKLEEVREGIMYYVKKIKKT